jgi:uncharacterized protein (DUF433 family)
MGDAADYVRKDQSSVLRVGNSRVMLESVLSSWSQGHSPETIRSQYPALTLEQVYGVIAWSLAHQAQVAEYLKTQDAIWEQWRRRSEAESSPLRDRLRAAKFSANVK